MISELDVQYPYRLTVVRLPEGSQSIKLSPMKRCWFYILRGGVEPVVEQYASAASELVLNLKDVLLFENKQQVPDKIMLLAIAGCFKESEKIKFVG